MEKKNHGVSNTVLQRTSPSDLRVLLRVPPQRSTAGMGEAGANGPLEGWDLEIGMRCAVKLHEQC